LRESGDGESPLLSRGGVFWGLGLEGNRRGIARLPSYEEGLYLNKSGE